MNEEFEKWARHTPSAVFMFDSDDEAALVRRVAELAWQASRKQALEEAATKAETEICECCWREDAKEAAEEIAFQIRAMQKE